MNAQTLPDVSKTIRVLSIARECSVVTDRAHHTVTIDLIGGVVTAWVDGVRVASGIAHSYLEGAEELTVLKEVRAVALAPDAIGTQGAWELRRALRLTGMTSAECVTYAGAVLGRELPCIAADTLTVAEGLAIIAQARSYLGNRASAYTNTLAGFRNGVA